VLSSRGVVSGGIPGGHPGYGAFTRTYTLPCVSALTQSLRSEYGWKPLLHGLLLATRDKRGRVRLGALQAITALFSAGGDEALVLVPEALPFLSETQHDEDTGVEAATHSLLAVLQAATGEDLSKYLA